MSRRDRPTILLVDDVPALRLLLRHSLQDEFDVVGEAGDGATAGELAARLHPDVVLLDLNMPDQDGLQAIGTIRAATPGTRIAVFTGLEATVVEATVRAMGADDFLEKSAPLDEVQARLRALVDGSALL